ncbi:uncharacterized protein LOC108914998 isoform X2 [Anoplophora glabripennis]|uniref:uncharacterized protein LOC108914998 isoform X2 n=1 Tax=Anoplophora glabripennis TaxID=217634 RepID=UPI000873FB82|nr:uncharacterized protein LOC108914998 isoform X2 [Anoplophora glabripennis]
MRLIITLVILCRIAVLAVPRVYENGKEADECTTDVCKASNGCRCSSSTGPLELNELTPQLISLTFEEIVTDDLFNNFWQPLLFNRVNPDGYPIGATFFVPHEYTDYKRVNDLYNHGFEIGVKSITMNPLPRYWYDANEDILEKEFGGQKKILNKFGNIPREHILGVRTPWLQLAGNSSIRAYQAIGLSYESSWQTSSDKPLFPYTLDYLSTQQCPLGVKCPNEEFRGFWILPINNLLGPDHKECNAIVTCNITGTSDEIAEWLIGEIGNIRNSTREPLTLRMFSYWFDFTENSRERFIKFLDKLASYDDVFLVTQKQVLDWMRNPVPLSDFKTDVSERNATCTPYSCTLVKPNGSVRYFKSCVPCPASYPWLDNPECN